MTRNDQNGNHPNTPQIGLALLLSPERFKRYNRENSKIEYYPMSEDDSTKAMERMVYEERRVEGTTCAAATSQTYRNSEVYHFSTA